MPPKRYPPVLLATCSIPWTAQYAFDAPLFTKSVNSLAAEMTPHLYLFGTAGEGYAVTDRQYQEITETFRAALPDNTVPMIGVISLSLGTIVERIQSAQALGFRDFQISFPSWGALTVAEVDRFFEATCGAFPDCRFLHYNLPRTKKLLTGDDYARLAARHPNLVAIKMGGLDTTPLADILEKAPELQCFFVEFGYAAMRDQYECGYIAAMAGGKPAWAREFHAARGDRLATMLDEAIAAREVLIKHVHAADAHMDGAYDKMNLKLLEPAFPLRLLPPYSAPDETAFRQFEAELPPTWLN
jgi:dihydrodipicolinate synthase/N-acetylneuraminate lyase